MTFRGSDLQSDSDLDSIHNSSDVFFMKNIILSDTAGAWGGVGVPAQNGIFSPNKYCSQCFGLIKLLVDKTRWVS